MADQVWAEHHPVRQVLHERRATHSKPGDRDDGYKMGLAIEGGGLRGVVSAAMLTFLEDLGYADAFDEVYRVRQRRIFHHETNLVPAVDLLRRSHNGKFS